MPLNFTKTCLNHGFVPISSYPPCPLNGESSNAAPNVIHIFKWILFYLMVRYLPTNALATVAVAAKVATPVADPVTPEVELKKVVTVPPP
uniref:Uncharacterized protein n=1 Tax=Parastrongyloides trichosuri TaxID=131310 RepID=A0A0N4ZZP6_PARTI